MEGDFFQDELTCTMGEFMNDKKTIFDKKPLYEVYNQDGYSVKKVLRCSRGSYQYVLKEIRKQDQSKRELNVLTYIRQHPHPNLLHIYLIDIQSNPMRIVMENGVYDLEKAVSAYNPKESRRLAWLVQVFLGMEFLHTGYEKAVYHKDLKPKNVI